MLENKEFLLDIEEFILDIDEFRKKPHPQVQWQRRAVKEGRGLGRGQDYKPFIQVRRQDFASHGLSQIMRNPQLNREHHFLSVLEYQIALMFLNCGVLDLREQFPLRLNNDDVEYARGSEFPLGTVSLASRLGFRHPRFSLEAPRILTTDMVVTCADGQEYAVFVRYAKDVPKVGSRQSQLLDLQRAYWDDRSVELVVLTERDVSSAKTSLLIWAQEGLLHPSNGASEEFLNFLRRAHHVDDSLRNLLSLWHEGFGPALARFKTGVFYGLITVRVPTRTFPSLGQRWDFNVTSTSDRANAVGKFLANARRRCGG